MAVVRHRIALDPAAAAAALGRGDGAVSEVWDALAAGDIDAVRIGRARPRPGVAAAVPDVTAAAPAPGGPECLLPGSFNPIHEAHRGMLEMAAARLRTAGAYELAIANPDKPPLSPGEAARRLAGFSAAEAVWLTRAPTFPEKAGIFPGATFAVGVDTLVRIAEPRYYGGPEGLWRAIAILGACRFLVFGRRTGAGFATLESVDLPAPLRALCDGVPETDFRADVSSTDLRRPRDDGDAALPELEP